MLKFTDFSTFLQIVKDITKEDLEKEKRLLFEKGKEIKSLDDIFINPNDELFELLPDGSLIRINLYIAIKEMEFYYPINPNELYKYHIYKCQTITQMFNSGRKHRYKINNRTDGTFYYTFSDYSGNVLKVVKNQKLNICKNCLKKYLGKKYVSDEDVKNFNLEEFYKKNNSFFGRLSMSGEIDRLEKGEYAIANVYSRLWNEIATKVKKKRKYICENCGFTPRNEYEKRFIHCHHINGDKTNNYEDNLKVLCIKCHSEVDIYHSRIKNSNNYQEFLKIYK